MRLEMEQSWDLRHEISVTTQLCRHVSSEKLGQKPRMALQVAANGRVFGRMVFDLLGRFWPLKGQVDDAAGC